MTHTPNENTLKHLIETVHRLRAPEGCPWDRAQTHQSLRRYLIEEAYEVLDVLDQVNDSSLLTQKAELRSSLQEELGDLLLQVLLHSELASETGAFTIYDVARTLDEKLVRRHPHVFGNESAQTADDALQNWEKQKQKDKDPDHSILKSLPKNLPALQRTARVIEKVTHVGFQWKDLKGPLDKMEEELHELQAEIRKLDSNPDPSLKKKVEAELGDFLFSLCNVGFLLKINPEDALRGTVSRFERRFRHIEKRLQSVGKTPEQSNQEEMDLFWKEAKNMEKAQVWGLTGGIGSGKSTAASIFRELGVPVIDADQIARSLTEPQGKAFAAVQTRFGTTDRTQLRDLIFGNHQGGDPQAKKDLEEILHPLIQEESREQIRTLAQKHSLIIYEAALLIETNRYRELDGLIVVQAPSELRVQRVLKRDQINPQVAKQIMDSQAPDMEKQKVANFVLDNSGTLEALRAQVIAFWKGFTA